jgi:hypothetical protein
MIAICVVTKNDNVLFCVDIPIEDTTRIIAYILNELNDDEIKAVKKIQVVDNLDNRRCDITI